MVKSFGFTLIELMVVVTIIGLLSSSVLAATSSARFSARDASQVNEIKQIQNALELYKARNGTYPCYSNGGGGCVEVPINLAGASSAEEVFFHSRLLHF